MKKCFLFLALTLISLSATAQTAQSADHPFLIVHDSDKQAVLDKIRDHEWARNTYDDMVKTVTPYVERHKSDPEWILSRYQMNWTSGKHYTDFYAAEPIALDSAAGNAPYPTVRVATYGRNPVNANGTSYRLPPIEEWVPYDTSSFAELYNPDTGEKEQVKPWRLVEGKNGQINQLARDAAIIYWLTGKEEYARFAADILAQFARGAYFMNPIHGHRSMGFIGLQTLNDAMWQPLMVAYDFIYPYLKKKRYEMKYYQPVWEKLARRTLVNGYWDCNWYAAESCTLMYAALLLEDDQKRAYYIDHFMNTDIKDGRWGHLSIRSTVSEWLTPDGHWKEPGGYHTYPVSNLLKAALTMERNGYPVFDKYPELFDAASAPMKYVYPNLYISSFGDSGRSVPSSELLELGFIFAEKYRPEALPKLQACAALLAKSGYFKRDRTNEFALLTYLPEIPMDGIGVIYNWPRSGEFDFAKFYLQRNGMDKDYGLMYTVQGATYNHNHVNGMAMELYGAGDVMGIDPGTGPYYEHPLHVTYFAQWAAHNTVVAAGASASIPFDGHGGVKEIGEQKLAAMEPMPEAAPISPYVSFTDTRYRDKSTDTRQQRTMALVRTSDRSGYYVDIFRSDNPHRNDYMYHNIGDRVELFDPSGRAIPQQPAQIGLIGDDYPGFRHISEVKATGKYLDDVRALFTLETGAPQTRYMQAIIPYNVDRNYYTGLSPKAKTAGSYASFPVPTLMIQSMGEAWAAPFVVVYEPYYAPEGPSVKSVTKLSRGNESNFVTLQVDGAKGDRQYIFQGLNNGKGECSGTKYNFKGYFGVVSLRGGRLQYVYLGKGKKLAFEDFTVEGQDDNCSVNIDFSEGPIKITANQTVTISLKKEGISSATLQSPRGRSELGITNTERGATFSVPAVRDGVIILK